MELSRRAILGTAACLGLSSKLFPFFEAAVGAESIRTRQNIKAFAADPGKVSALRAAVGHMKELSNSNRHDPFGWSYWASSHGSPDPPSTQEPKDPNAMPLYRQCKNMAEMACGSRISFLGTGYFYFFSRPFSSKRLLSLAKRRRSTFHTGTGTRIPFLRSSRKATKKRILYT